MSYITEEKQGCPTEGEGNTFRSCEWNICYDDDDDDDDHMRRCELSRILLQETLFIRYVIENCQIYD